MSGEKQESLYFIALVPPEPFLSDVQKLKLEVSEKFASKAALKSPAHVTLHMPFRYKESKEQRITDALDSFVKNHGAFSVSVKNFGCFEPRVIYIDVELTELLSRLQSDLLRHIRRELKIENDNYKGRGFHPHMTIAFRDLKKSVFPEAWQYFSQKEICFTWNAQQISLLKHNGNFWEVMRNYTLK